MGKSEQSGEPVEEVRIEYGSERRTAEPGKDTPEPVTLKEVKERIAEKVREDGREFAGMIPSQDVFEIVPGPQQDKITSILEEMSSDGRYADIKAVTTASGMVFFLSSRYIETDKAIETSRIEELKFLIAEKIRADSQNDVKLTSVADLQSLAPEREQEGIAAILDAMRTDERYADIRAVTSPNGNVYYHSDRHMSGYYAIVLSRVAAKDPSATIAAMVRDESRIYPRPTCVQLFTEEIFGIPSPDLRAIVEETMRKPEFDDIRMMIHPTTGGVYLYSSKYLNQSTAWSLMDWQEVVRDANP